jgi:hypothetical protein
MGRLLALLGHLVLAVVFAGVQDTVFGAVANSLPPASSAPAVVTVDVEDAPAGAVAEHRGDTLVVVPWHDAPMTAVKATDLQRQACPVNARFPECLP